MAQRNPDGSYFDDFFSNLSDVELRGLFSYNPKWDSFLGEFSISVERSTLDFRVHIPSTYPVGEIRFFCLNVQGLPHQFLRTEQETSGTLCLSTPFIDDREERLKEEVRRLKKWIEDYYIQEKQDSHYELPFISTQGKYTLLFQESEEDSDGQRWNPNPFGQFTYSVLNGYSDAAGALSHITILAHELGNSPMSGWSSLYKGHSQYLGFWAFLGKEPVRKKKDRLTHWEDLYPMLPEGFSSAFQNFRKATSGTKIGPKGFNKYILLTLGYYIPVNDKKKEVHWDLVLLPQENYSRKRVREPFYQKEQTILWDYTYNCHYQRFFGRGKFEDDICSLKILVIGTGAIGSAVAEILARGGALHLDIADFDFVAPGNICRSSFAFADVNNSKVNSLQTRLRAISPFIEVNICHSFEVTSPASPKYKDIKNELASYDLIFDCTANNQVLHTLNSFQFGEPEIIYLSITNKAEELLFLFSHDSPDLMDRRNQWLTLMEKEYEVPEFWEGTGCWHPTFEAAAFDIQPLLFSALRHWNGMVKKQIPWSSFVAAYEGSEIVLNTLHHYYQPDLEISLVITSDCLEKIRQYSWHHFPYEYGGLLMGSYSANGKEVFINDIIVPENYYNSSISFTADTYELNIRLLKHALLEKRPGEYIGDWHTHPNSSNRYSSVDFKAMATIASADTVVIENPILMVVSIGEEYFDPGFYVFHQKELWKYEPLAEAFFD